MPRSRKIIIIAIFLIIIAIIVIYFVLRNNHVDKDKISASGSIEALEIDVSTQIPGQITSLYVDEGDYVEKGKLLAEIDHKKLDIQLRQAQANLTLAETRLNQAKILAKLTDTQIKTQIQQAKAIVDTSSSKLSQAKIAHDLQGTAIDTQIQQAESSMSQAIARLDQAKELYELQQAQSKNQIEQSEALLKMATSRLAVAQKGAREQEINVAENLVAQAKANFDTAKQNLDRIQKLYSDGAISKQQLDMTQLQHDVAQSQYKSAQEQLSLAKEGARTEDKDALQAQVDQANSTLQLAKSAQIQNDIRKNDIENAMNIVKQAESALTLAKANALQGNLRKEDISTAQAGVEQAKSALELAEANTLQSQIQNQNILLAETQVKSAKDAVEFLQAQIDDTKIISPISGTVIRKVAEKGELVALGTPIFVVADLSSVYLTIYIPETILGKIKLGQNAEVKIDSFPNKSFNGKVIYISQEAEFTPKNIQTKDERVKLVYGVKIKINNPNGELKSGMPADAIILLQW